MGQNQRNPRVFFAALDYQPPCGVRDALGLMWTRQHGGVSKVRLPGLSYFELFRLTAGGGSRSERREWCQVEGAVKFERLGVAGHCSTLALPHRALLYRGDRFCAWYVAQGKTDKKFLKKIEVPWSDDRSRF